jgi:hypothetical protein
LKIAVSAVHLFCGVDPDFPRTGVFSCRFKAAVKPLRFGGGSPCPDTLATEHITANLDVDGSVNFEPVR